MEEKDSCQMGAGRCGNVENLLNNNNNNNNNNYYYYYYYYYTIAKKTVNKQKVTEVAI